MHILYIYIFVAGHVLAAEIQIIYPKNLGSHWAHSYCCRKHVHAKLLKMIQWPLCSILWMADGRRRRCRCRWCVCCVFALLFCYYLCLPDFTSLLVIFKWIYFQHSVRVLIALRTPAGAAGSATLSHNKKTNKKTAEYFGCDGKRNNSGSSIHLILFLKKREFTKGTTASQRQQASYAVWTKYTFAPIRRTK